MTLNEILLLIAILVIAVLAVIFIIILKKDSIRQLEETQYYDDNVNCYTYKGFIWALGKSQVRHSVVALEILFGDGSSNQCDSNEVEILAKNIVKASKEELGVCIIGYFRSNNLLIAIPSTDSSFILSKMENLKNRIMELNRTFIKLSILYGVCGEEGTPQKQVEKATYALKYAKRKNINAVYYDERVFKMQNNFNRILNNPNLIGDEFGVYYQPIVKGRTGELVAAESKVRWLGENGQILYFPKEFLEEFTTIGFITQIDLYVFETVCSFLDSLVKRKILPVVISVNIAGIDLLNPFFIENVKKIISKYEFDIKNVHFLISGIGDFDNQTAIDKSIKAIKELGIEIEGNNFGSEYTDEQLLNPTFTAYKLNESFMRNQLRTNNDQIILKSFVEMIEKVNKTAIIKNIDTPSVVEYAKKCGKNVLLQGNYLFQAIPVSNFETLLQDNRRVIDNTFMTNSDTPEVVEEVNEVAPAPAPTPVVEPTPVHVEEVKDEPVIPSIVIDEVTVEEVKEEPVEEIKEKPKSKKVEEADDDEEEEMDDDVEEDDDAADNDAEEEKIAKLMAIYKKQFQDQWEQEMLRKYPELMKKHYARRNFYERVVNLSPDNKKYYNMIKNKIMSYSDITNATTNYFDTFINKRRIFFKIAIVGKSIKIYLALNPNNYPTGQFPHKDASDIKRHEKTPFVMKVSSNLAIRRANILIDDLARLNQISPREDYKEKDYIKSMQSQVRNNKN